MGNNIQEKLSRNRGFYEMQETDRPMLGCFIGGWEDLSRYSTTVHKFITPGIVSAEDIVQEAFIPMYDDFIANLDYDNDDFIRGVEPVNSIPWSEAALGCPVRFTGKNFWSSPMGRQKFEALMDSGKDPAENNLWIEKYGQFIDFLAARYPDYPIGQSITRGSLDMLCAALGDSEVILLSVLEPDFIERGLKYCEQILYKLCDVQTEHFPMYHGGYGMGYYLFWMDKPSFRLQQDGIALLNPTLYEELVHPSSVRLAKHAKSCVFHTHSTTNYIMDKLVENPYIDVVQVTKDAGSVPIEDMIKAMQVIQAAGKPVLFKGRLTYDEAIAISKNVDKRGLCLGVVTDTKESADGVMAMLKSIDW